MPKAHKNYIKREIGFLYHSELQFQNDFRLYFVIYHSLKNLYQKMIFLWSVGKSINLEKHNSLKSIFGLLNGTSFCVKNTFVHIKDCVSYLVRSKMKAIYILIQPSLKYEINVS